MRGVGDEEEDEAADMSTRRGGREGGTRARRGREKEREKERELARASSTAHSVAQAGEKRARELQGFPARASRQAGREGAHDHGCGPRCARLWVGLGRERRIRLLRWQTRHERDWSSPRCCRRKTPPRTGANSAI